ncbi:MAG: rane fusion protein multidrug efflux system [Shewanella sp.]|nr:rane fusion protein multidrug efflux system [Shewanella sp.]
MMLITPCQSCLINNYNKLINTCAMSLRWLSVGLLLAALSGCDDAGQSAALQPIRPVKTVVVKAVETTPKITQVGDIEAYQQTSLGFRIAGRVLERRVDVGTSVHQGDILATLDPSNASNALKQAKAELESAKSAETLAKRNLERMKNLLPDGAISQSYYDQSLSDWQTAKSRLDHARAAMSDAKDNLQFTQLRAPLDGVISETNANAGQVVNAGQQIFRLAYNGRLDAVFEVPEQVLQTKLEDPKITVSLLSDPSVHAAAKFRDVTPQADPYTRTYRVRVTLVNPPSQMKLGAIVRGQLFLAPVKQVVIPKQALTRQEQQPAVYIVNLLTGELRLQAIQIARYSDDAIYVTSGLTLGDHVVIAGVDKLRPGLKVRLMQGAL